MSKFFNFATIMAIVLTRMAVPMTYAQNLDENGALPRATPESVGVSSVDLVETLKAFDEKITRVDSVMILRDGKVICEAWRSPASPTEPHPVYSLSKSVAATAIGFAVDEGKMTLDQKIVDIFPEDVPENVDENLTKATIRDLLMMACGHESEPPRSHNAQAFYDLEGPKTTPDLPTWAQAFMRQPTPFEPGTHFTYNTVGTYMASAALERSVGEELTDFLMPRLFEPLQIARPVWEKSPEGYTKGGTGLYLTTEDIAKFGQFYLQKGVWNGERLLSEEWVKEATRKQISTGDETNNSTMGYGYQFWRCVKNAYRGDGKYAQLCVIMPDQNAVVAITSDSSQAGETLDIVFDLLVPKMQDAPLPENPEGVAKLRDFEKSLKPKEGASGSQLVSCAIHNDALDQDMRYIVYLPNGYLTSSMSFPVLYLLHGLSDDEKTWSSLEKGQLKRICDEYFAERPEQKRIIIMPDARATWYRDAVDGPDQYETFFFNEFIPHVEKEFRCQTDRESRAIAGLSMGGYGTFLYALRRPDMFSAAYGMSPAVSYGQNRPQRNEVGSDEEFEKQMEWARRNDVFLMLDSYQDKEAVRFMVDCGDDDFCLPGAFGFFMKSRQLGIPCELRVRDGVHSWNYWRDSLPQALDFIMN
ncbi:MAG: serine hydrolase [Thermoguttaceae bacterium]|jgi:CubicO group peptidase (beta-lactamase class C family)/S-formylglutathione hydrolase FrmB